MQNKIKNQNNNVSFFERLYLLKDNFCRNIIIKLDKIITFCSNKNELKIINQELSDVKNLKHISKVFDENRNKLASYISFLESENVRKTEIINLLYLNFQSGNLKEIEKIFSELGFNDINNKKEINE